MTAATTGLPPFQQTDRLLLPILRPAEPAFKAIIICLCQGETSHAHVSNRTGTYRRLPMPGRTSPQSMFYSSVPSAEKPDRTTVPRARSTVLFPLQRNQTGPQSPEHVLQFCSLIRKARRQQVELLALRRYIGK